MIGVIALPMVIADVPIWLKLLFFFGFYFSLLYVMSATILVCCLSRMVSTMINTLGHQEKSSEERQETTNDQWKLNLIQWRHSYQVINELVDKINHCFGPVFMIMILTSFVRYINQFFFIAMMLKKENLEWHEIHTVINLLCTLMGVAIHNLALINASHGMRKEVGLQYKEMFKIGLSLKNKVSK